MPTRLTIVPERPYEDGVAAGRQLDRREFPARLNELLRNRWLRTNLALLERAELERLALARLETPPDFAKYPELAVLYPERVAYVRGLAKGAGCSLGAMATLRYVEWRAEIARWHGSLNDLGCSPQPTTVGCSGVLMVGPDGVIGAQCGDTLPDAPPPAGYRFRPPPPHGRWLATAPRAPRTLRISVPPTGYAMCGATSETGVACLASVSCSTLLDDPIEDTWPVQQVPLLRFARNVRELITLYRRYNLHNWTRASQIYADTKGGGVVIEKSFRRIGVRKLEGPAAWCTEGYWHDPAMHAFQRERRLAFVARTGKGLGAGDLQYLNDGAVRFTRLAELCTGPGHFDLAHLNRVVTDHAPFPRAACRHCGPDTAPYDHTVTLGQWMADLTHNRKYDRGWLPWRRFCCERPWVVTQFPPLADLRAALAAARRG